MNNRSPKSGRRKIEVKQGDRYNRLTVIKEIDKRGTHRYFDCECDCGNTKSVSLDSLRRGLVKSCGCLHRERVTKHGGAYSRLYSIWANMKSRINNPNASHYNHYGGRGISICKEWYDFSNFQKWANDNGYQDTLTIDRIDNDGNYSPDNCKWSTIEEQSKNRQIRKR